MKLYTIILAILLLPKFASASRETNPPDSNIVRILGDTIADVMFSPQKITVYKLEKVFDTLAVKVDDCENFVRDSLLTDIRPETYCKLDSVLLSDTANYQLDSVKIRSQYYPILEFDLEKGDEIVKIRISTNDYSWTIIRHNKVFRRFNYSNKELVERFCKMFL